MEDRALSRSMIDSAYLSNARLRSPSPAAPPTSICSSPSCFNYRPVYRVHYNTSHPSRKHNLSAISSRFVRRALIDRDLIDRAEEKKSNLSLFALYVIPRRVKLNRGRVKDEWLGRIFAIVLLLLCVCLLSIVLMRFCGHVYAITNTSR